MRYILINEFGEIFRSAEVGQLEFSLHADGLLDIIDTKTQQSYQDGEWQKISMWDEAPTEEN